MAPGLEVPAVEAAGVPGLGIEVVGWGETEDPYAEIARRLGSVSSVGLANRMWAEPNVRLIYTAHSVPVAMAESSDYEKQLNESCRLVSEGVGIGGWQLVYQSRSGPPGQPWLEPDIGDVLRGLEPGAPVVVVPIGFISDHMEVLFDLDTEARAIAEERGLDRARAATVGVHAKFLSMIRELILEKTGQCKPRAVGKYGPHQDICRAGCCPAPAGRPSPAITPAG